MPRLKNSYGEDFYSWRFFNAWGVLPKEVREAKRVGVSSDETGTLWAVNAWKIHLILNTLTRKIVYQEHPADSDPDSAYWLQVSPNGKYIVQMNVEEGGGTDFGKVISVSDGHELPCELVAVESFLSNDRYILGTYKGKSGRCVYDSEADGYYPIDSRFVVSGIELVTEMPDGKTLFGTDDQKRDMFRIWELPDLKMVKSIYLPGVFPFVGKHGNLLAVQGPDEVLFYDSRSKLRKKFAFFEKGGKLEAALDLESGGGLTGGNENAYGGPQNHPPRVAHRKRVHDGRNCVPLVMPDEERDGFWVVAFPDGEGPRAFHTEAVYINDHLEMEKVIQYDKAIVLKQPKTGIRPLCRWREDHGAFLCIDVQGNMIELPIH
jgi:hypothetical protein